MRDPFLVLGIESSCDETAAAIVRSDGAVLSSQVASQMEIHAAHGGVVPEIAARAHLDSIDIVIGAALRTAGVDLDAIEGVAATGGPGLIGGVVVGTVAAKPSRRRGIPITRSIISRGMRSARGWSRPFLPYLLLRLGRPHAAFAVRPRGLRALRHDDG